MENSEKCKRLEELNARLYEACKSMLKDYERGDIEIDHKTRQLIKEAIAKVEDK